MRRVVIAAALLCIGVSISAFAQTSNATLGGTVADAAGALIPGVAVSARNVGTGIVNETLTNETGTYQFSNLQTGTYEVRAELGGFQTQRFTNVILGVAQQVRLNFTLTIAGLATTVEVTAVADTVGARASTRSRWASSTGAIGRRDTITTTLRRMSESARATSQRRSPTSRSPA